MEGKRFSLFSAKTPPAPGCEGLKILLHSAAPSLGGGAHPRPRQTTRLRLLSPLNIAKHLQLWFDVFGRLPLCHRWESGATCLHRVWFWILGGFKILGKEREGGVAVTCMYTHRVHTADIISYFT